MLALFTCSPDIKPCQQKLMTLMKAFRHARVCASSYVQTLCNIHHFPLFPPLFLCFSGFGPSVFWPDCLMALTVNLIGPSPWGFRIYGGRDFKKAITVSKVLPSSFTVVESSHILSHHTLCFCQNIASNDMSCKVNFLCSTSLFSSLFLSVHCLPASLTTEPVRMEWKSTTLEGNQWLQL